MAWTNPPHRTQHWQVTKPAAYGPRGMVVAQSHTAALAGISLLDAGGNAADAAIGTAFALAVVEPWNSGLGGVGFAVVHQAGLAETLDFGPISPGGLDPALFPLTGGRAPGLFSWPGVVGDTNVHGPLSACIPSAVAGYALLHRRYGRVPLADIMAPAIALARRGLPADWFTTLKIANTADTLRRYPATAQIYLPTGLPPVAPFPGPTQYLPLSRLADTLDHLSRAGLDDFYCGDVAASLCADIAAAGGVISAADLAGYQARLSPAPGTAWQGGVLHLAGRLTAAPLLTDVLAGLPTVLRGTQPDAAWFEALAGTMLDAYRHRLAEAGEGCTTHVNVCDAEGGMVALTSTLLSSMGSGLVLPATGVLLNNGVMWFDPTPGAANAIGPLRRPLTNMCPVIVSRSGTPIIATGASGGRRIMAAVAQMLAFVQDFGMTLSEAAHHPRIDVSGADTIHADIRLDPAILAQLAKATPTEVTEHGVIPISFGCPGIIIRDDDGCAGISDVMSPWSAAVAQ